MCDIATESDWERKHCLLSELYIHSWGADKWLEEFHFVMEGKVPLGNNVLMCGMDAHVSAE